MIFRLMDSSCNSDFFCSHLLIPAFFIPIDTWLFLNSNHDRGHLSLFRAGIAGAKASKTGNKGRGLFSWAFDHETDKGEATSNKESDDFDERQSAKKQGGGGLLGWIFEDEAAEEVQATPSTRRGWFDWMFDDEEGEAEGADGSAREERKAVQSHLIAQESAGKKDGVQAKGTASRARDQPASKGGEWPETQLTRAAADAGCKRGDFARSTRRTHTRRHLVRLT